MEQEYSESILGSWLLPCNRLISPFSRQLGKAGFTFLHREKKDKEIAKEGGVEVCTNKDDSQKCVGLFPLRYEVHRDESSRRSNGQRTGGRRKAETHGCTSCTYAFRKIFYESLYKFEDEKN
jgi:hypothetical protein